MNRFSKETGDEENGVSDGSQPMRSYTDEAHEISPSMINYQLETTAYWLVPLVIFLTILIGGTYVAFKFNIFGEWGSDAEQRYTYYDAAGNIVVSKLLDSYLTVVGGRAALEGIRSIRYKGRLIESDSEIPFQLLLSSPDKGMIMTTPGEDYSQRLVYNDGVAWQVVDLGDGTRKHIELGRDDTVALAWSLRLHNTFRRLVLSDAQAVQGFSVREMTFSGRPSIELTKAMPDGSELLVVLDKETLHLLMTEETAPGSGGPERVQSIYEDYQNVSGILFSLQTKFYKHGELFNETILESVEVNPGLVSALFEIPEELSNPRD